MQGGSLVRSKRLLSLLITVFMFAGLSIPAQACTAIYAGSEMTDTGDHASEITTQGSIAIIEQVCQNVSLPVESYR